MKDPLQSWLENANLEKSFPKTFQLFTRFQAEHHEENLISCIDNFSYELGVMIVIDELEDKKNLSDGFIPMINILPENKLQLEAGTRRFYEFGKPYRFKKPAQIRLYKEVFRLLEEAI